MPVAHRRDPASMPGVASFDDPGFFGAHWASVYDVGPERDPSAAVAFLAELACGGRTLELAIGSGRVALPLAARGVAVEGIEAAREMVGLLRSKPGGRDIPVTIGDMADVPVEGPFQLVYLVYNTLFNLPDADRQVDCFTNVARVLAPDGAFVIECFVLDPAQYDHGRPETYLLPLAFTKDSDGHDAARAPGVVIARVTLTDVPERGTVTWVSEDGMRFRVEGLPSLLRATPDVEQAKSASGVARSDSVGHPSTPASVAA